jgi:hypothetical protein
MKTSLLCICLLAVSGHLCAQSDQPSLPPGDHPPPTAFDRLERSGTAEDFDSAAYAIVLDMTVNTVNELGITYTDSYLLYKVLTEEGCKKLAVNTWRYEPLSSFVDVKEVNILRNGKSITVPIDKVLDLPAPQRGIYWQDRIKTVQLPRLHVGDGVEIKLFRKGYSYALLDSVSGMEPDDERYIPPMPGEYFDIVLFESQYPTVERKYVLRLPSDKRLHSQVYNGPLFSHTTYDGDTTIYSWWAKDIPAWKPQRYRPAQSDILTKVVIATVESWEAKSRWFFEVNENQFEYTDAIKAKVDEILAGAGVADGTDEQKAFELVHWVAQNIRYSGQTMGQGEGYTLHSGAMIFEQRSGVCKDIAGMLVTMMRAAGLDSYAAMTMAGSRIEEVPADQFNHCVVALKKEDRTFVMYDPTWVPFDRGIWSKLETEQHYLIGTPEGEPLSRIAYSPPEESPLMVTSTCRILPDGTLEGSFELRGEGAMDRYLRCMLTWYRLSETEHRLARMLSSLSDRIEISKYERGDVLDFNRTMYWKIDYRVPEYALPVDGGFEFRSPMLRLTNKNSMLFRAGSYDWPEKRRDDVFFYFTELLDGKETIKLPKGYTVTDLKKSDEIDETYAYFKGESDMTKKGLAINQKAEIRRRQIPEDGYDGFRKTIKEFQKYAETVFRAEKGGAK